MMKSQSPQDIRPIEQATTKKYFWTINLAIPCAILLFAGAGLISLAQADRLARLEGGSVHDIWNAWIAGVDVGRTYSGVHVKATERLTNGVMYFTAALIFMTPIWIVANVRIRRLKRVHEFIKQNTSDSEGAEVQ